MPLAGRFIHFEGGEVRCHFHLLGQFVANAFTLFQGQWLTIARGQQFHHQRAFHMLNALLRADVHGNATGYGLPRIGESAKGEIDRTGNSVAVGINDGTAFDTHRYTFHRGPRDRLGSIHGRPLELQRSAGNERLEQKARIGLELFRDFPRHFNTAVLHHIVGFRAGQQRALFTLPCQFKIDPWRAPREHCTHCFAPALAQADVVQLATALIGMADDGDTRRFLACEAFTQHLQFRLGAGIDGG